MTGEELFKSLEKSFGEKLQAKTQFRGETSYTIAASDVREIAKSCREQFSFDYLISAGKQRRRDGEAKGSRRD